jgi:4-amino-4-deoxy-L-arabinose transferase-like glycosyltransferase
MKRIRYAWLGLFLIFTLYAGLVWSLTPTNYFGLTEDDSLYFSSGKALAEGHGYILPSLPGSPPATKYPVLYPWLMSLVWRALPSFPQNLKIAIAFNVACGFVFLAVTFAFLRTIRELTVPERLAITALCAVHPMVLFHSANVLPEIPFAALSLGAITLATRSASTDGGEFESAASGVLSGLALLTRTLGLPIAAGLFLATIARTQWRKSIYFVGGFFPSPHSHFGDPCMSWLRALQMPQRHAPTSFECPGFTTLAISVSGRLTSCPAVVSCIC